jgi:hypothetical protein
MGHAGHGVGDRVGDSFAICTDTVVSDEIDGIVCAGGEESVGTAVDDPVGLAA